MSNVTRPAHVTVSGREGNTQRTVPRLRRIKSPFQRRPKDFHAFELSKGVGLFIGIGIREDAWEKKRPTILLISGENIWKIGFRTGLCKVY
jgi:hypothetical protein